jgi:hypothetical protein
LGFANIVISFTLAGSQNPVEARGCASFLRREKRRNNYRTLSEENMRSKSALKLASLQGHEIPVVSRDDALHRQIESRLLDQSRKTSENLEWLHNNMHPYFFITMKEEVEAIIHLAERLPDVASEKEVVLVNQEKKQMIARLDVPGSIYDTLKTLREREISYAEMSHSYNPIPHVGKYLEIQRYEFDRKSHEEIGEAGLVKIPGSVKGSVQAAMKREDLSSRKSGPCSLVVPARQTA